MKTRYFGYILYCEGCAIDIKYGSFKEGPCGALDSVVSDPIYSTAAEALKAGRKECDLYESSYCVSTYELKL